MTNETLIATPPEPEPAPEAPKKNNNTTIIIVAVVAVVLLCCCCIALGGAVWLWNNGDALIQSL